MDSAFYLSIHQVKKKTHLNVHFKVLKVEAVIFLWCEENHLLSFITGRGDIHGYEDHHPAYVPVGTFLRSASKYQERDV